MPDINHTHHMNRFIRPDEAMIAYIAHRIYYCGSQDYFLLQYRFRRLIVPFPRRLLPLHLYAIIVFFFPLYAYTFFEESFFSLRGVVLK